MQVKIGFTNPNLNAEGIRVYRSTSAIDVTALPAPIATLAGNATEYIDTSVLKDQTYFYVFEVFNGANVTRTGNIKATVTFYSGPGNQVLKGGDLSCGYYGIVSSADFIDWDTFIGQVGVTTVGKHNQAGQDWLKYIYKGKVLFMPRQPIGTVSWNSLYLKGLVYGVDGPGPRDFNTQVATNQLKVLNIQGHQFKVRLMRGLPVGADLTAPYLAANNSPLVQGIYSNSGTPESYVSQYDLSGSEWNDLLMRTISWSIPNQKGANWDRLENLMYFNGTAYLGWNSDTFCMEMLSTGSIIGRGALSLTANVAARTLHPGYAIGINPASNFHWWPVLEMI
jgi:hypothetical protein